MYGGYSLPSPFLYLKFFNNKNFIKKNKIKARDLDAQALIWALTDLNAATGHV